MYICASVNVNVINYVFVCVCVCVNVCVCVCVYIFLHVRPCDREITLHLCVGEWEGLICVWPSDIVYLFVCAQMRAYEQTLLRFMSFFFFPLWFDLRLSFSLPHLSTSSVCYSVSYTPSLPLYPYVLTLSIASFISSLFIFLCPCPPPTLSLFHPVLTVYLKRREVAEEMI